MTAASSLRQTGFTLIEALIALLVASFGMLAIAAFQGTLSGSSDIAKQRSEAVRLAQLKIEQLRAYQQVASDPNVVNHKFNYTDDVVSGNDTVGPSSGAYATNTTYTRAWTVTGSGTDLQKWVRVDVSWQDRNGATQTVSLQSVIARADPISIGMLAAGPGTMNARTPKNRNVDVPYPAITLADGKTSAFQPGSDVSPNPNPFFVFNNVTGNVIGFCTNALTAADTPFDANGVPLRGDCTSRNAYLLSGYIRFVSGNYNSNQVDNYFGNPTDPTFALTADIAFVLPTTSATTSCFTQRQKVVSASAGSVAEKTIASASRTGGVVTITTTGNHGFSADQIVSISDLGDASFNGVYVVATTPNNTTFTYLQSGANASSPTGGPLTPTAILVQRAAIPESATAPTGYSSVLSRYVAYTCIVTPVVVTSGAPARWSGQFLVTPQPTNGTPWTLGTGASDRKLCRYTGDYYPDGVLSNNEHPLYYRGVTGTLDNQNYVVVDGNRACPNDGPANTATGDYVNSNTSLHQTVAAPCTLPCNGALSGTNGGGAANNGGISTAEPSNTATELPMFEAGN